MTFVFGFVLFNLIIALSNQEITDCNPQLVPPHERSQIGLKNQH